jgi:hypothetical protein
LKEKDTAVLLRIMNTYSQVITIISSFNLFWPSAVLSLFGSMGAPASAS